MLAGLRISPQLCSMWTRQTIFLYTLISQTYSAYKGACFFHLPEEQYSHEPQQSSNKQNQGIQSQHLKQQSFDVVCRSLLVNMKYGSWLNLH
jgi:hypothetical protein